MQYRKQHAKDAEETRALSVPQELLREKTSEWAKDGVRSSPTGTEETYCGTVVKDERQSEHFRADLTLQQRCRLVAERVVVVSVIRPAAVADEGAALVFDIAVVAVAVVVVVIVVATAAVVVAAVGRGSAVAVVRPGHLLRRRLPNR